MGLTKLHERLNHEMEEEIQHVDAIVNRMLFLEAEPDFTQQAKPEVGSTVVEMLQNDLKGEVLVAEMLKDIMKTCEEVQDFDTRDILQVLLHDTEMDHIYWLEQQLELIDKIGPAELSSVSDVIRANSAKGTLAQQQTVTVSLTDFRFFFYLVLSRGCST